MLLHCLEDVSQHPAVAESLNLTFDTLGEAGFDSFFNALTDLIFSTDPTVSTPPLAGS